jgi:hypothetical protein
LLLPPACSSDAFRSALPSELAFGEEGFHPFIKQGDAVVFEVLLIRLLERGLLRNVTAPNISMTGSDDFLRPL